MTDEKIPGDDKSNQAPVISNDDKKTTVEPTETPEPTEKNKQESADTKELESRIEGSVTEKVSKSLLEKIGGALGLTKEEKAKLPDDPEELARFVRDESKKGVQEILTEREKAEQQEQAEKDKQISEGAERFRTLWKDQYNQLAESGRVPKIVNAADKNDPGNVAKIKILIKLSQIIKENQEKGIDYVPTLKEVFYENPNIISTATVAGADSPVSGGGRAPTPGGPMPYDQLKKTSIEDLVANRNSSS